MYNFKYVFMMKRLLILSALALLIHVPSLAYDFSAKNDDGKTIYYNISDDEVSVTYNSTTYSYSGDIVIPETVTYNDNTYIVTSIGDRAFFNCSGLTEITIPNNVTSIGESAFYDCSGLTEVTIPNSVTTIGVRAFYRCTGIKDLTFEDGKETLELGTSYSSSARTTYTPFSGCYYIKTLYLGRTLSIDSTIALFGDITTLSSVIIGDYVTSVPSYIFSGCTGLTYVSIGNSVTSIGSSAFSNCSGLTSVTIGNSVTTIGMQAFRGCSSLTGVTIPNSVTSISSGVFRDCNGLQTLAFEDGEINLSLYTASSVDLCLNCPIETLYIGRTLSYSNEDYSPFAGITTLYSVTIGEHVTEIPKCTFKNCTNLTELIFNATSCISVGSTINERAFYGCTNIKEASLGNNVAIIPAYLFYGCENLMELQIPNSVTEIGDYALYKCSELTGDLNISDGVTRIGEYAFYYCSNLTGDINLPKGITEINNYTFYKCSNLSKVTIPESVTKIGEYAFYGCSNMTGEINLPVGITEINKSTFYWCSNLSKVTIPESVTSIGDYAFCNCSGLTEVNFNATACTSAGSSLSSSAFSGCSNIPTINFGDNVTIIPAYLCYNLVGLKEITIPNSVTSIGNDAFYNCTKLTEVNFNATACTSAGSSSAAAFNGCSKLSMMNIGDNVTIIPAYLCCNLVGLKEITIPNSVTSLGSYAFYNCSGLTGELTISESMTSISNYAFSGCTGLTSVTIPNSVISIGGYAFSSCTKLSEVTIPESVTSIGDYVFYSCSRLWSTSSSKTQTICKIKVTSNISGVESGIVYSKKFYSSDDEGYCIFADLTPGNSYSYEFGIMLSNDSYSIHGNSISLTTTAINPQITQISLTPESFIATGSYTEGDAEVTEVGFTGYETDGKNLILTNLEPSYTYTIEYYVTAAGKKFTTSTKINTPAVEFTTLPAKATSNTVALLGATTNLSDDAVGAGFEWRRNDAPSTMPSNQAECPVIDGELTGTLNGLSATTYYDFRPYYTSQGGTTYYGDWVTLITADAYVYFEPTVRTYSATSVGSESATVKAYAVAGSDNITSQGFEYWAGGSSSSAMNVKRASTTDENGVTRVEVSGQWMTATFEDLEPSTIYSYRAYVTTAVGTTYGETMTFTTDVPTGIEATTLSEDTEVYEIARYTMDGKKVSQPVRGINIIRYSDGTTRKVLVK